ncbi:O-antigen ligase [uncultured Bacteroides sp.]|uniref:O-antigen ligase family protein n=1 Tax=uncultured Bacteroides sp. TaxID=162156 RepID=UPI0025CD9EC0|nr:O-antigen ligase family protein [uncultured Bacteroides sp.]
MTNEKKKYSRCLAATRNYCTSKGWIHLFLVSCICILYKAIFQTPLPLFLAISLLPFALLLFLLVIKYSKQSFYTLFILQFILAAANIVVDIPLGIATLVCTLFTVALLLSYTIYKKVDWTESRNGMLLLFLIWGCYCVLELANPNNVQVAWNISITHYFIYPVVCAILVPLAIRDVKGIQWLLIIWSIFILMGAAKGYWQKNHGFNARELYFLYELGGAKTHIIWSGIRYFSFFSDAANFGVHMAMGISIFGISIFYVKNLWMKAYFAIVVLAAIYGMGISGTRAAVAVPIGALGAYIVLSRNLKSCIVGLSTLLIFFIFFTFTNIGDGNQYIRKMRSAFRPGQDASYQLRVMNREKMKELMVHKPFGYGIGLSKGERFQPKERMPYPPDSWLISVWVETGIVGLILYLAIHGALFVWCGWILMFKVMNKRLRGLLMSWLCMAAGFYLAAYANDVMQYPNSIPIYTAFALCFTGRYIDKRMQKEKETKLINKQ